MGRGLFTIFDNGTLAVGLPGGIESGDALDVSTGDKTLEPAWFLIVLRIVFGAVVKPLGGMVVIPAGVLGDIFCFDLGLGWVIRPVEVVVLCVTVLVAGSKVGGALEICVLPTGGWLG